MGHIRLAVLPQSRRWRAVVELLADGALPEEVVSASAVAAEREIAQAADDPLFVEAIRLLAMIPQAARREHFGDALRELGIDAREQPQLIDLVAAAGSRLDRFAQERRTRSDFGELSRKALLTTLSRFVGDALPSLFAATPADTQSAVAHLGTLTNFSRFARAFYTNLLSGTLGSWLDRALSAHVGARLRFADMGQRTAFDAALQQYCLEATRIISEFAGGWYGKTLHREGRIETRHAAAFGAVAFKKISSELRRKRDADA